MAGRRSSRSSMESRTWRSAGCVDVGNRVDVRSLDLFQHRGVPVHLHDPQLLVDAVRDFQPVGVLLVAEAQPMDKVIPMPKKTTTAEYRQAWLLGFLMVEYLPAIMPKASIAEKRKVADEALLVCAGKRPRMTPELLSELIAIHSSCVHDQEGKCPLLVSVRSLCWETNLALGLGNEEDKGFRRVNEMCAARPLGAGRFREDQ